ncbi:hypothetical protein KR215_010205 [Drosophila sulfurigaster]|nr:hypothetical protein KR215_010205 [Drosophila sulfurigaster]
MEHISVGDKVIISRTDGRVHAAIIMSKNDEDNFVTVSWLEANKVMGKEICLNDLLTLNPHLEFSDQSDDKPMAIDDANLSSSENDFPPLEPGSNGL